MGWRGFQAGLRGVLHFRRACAVVSSTSDCFCLPWSRHSGSLNGGKAGGRRGSPTRGRVGRSLDGLGPHGESNGKVM